MRLSLAGVAVFLLATMAGCTTVQPTTTPTATLEPLPNTHFAQLLDFVPSDLSTYAQSDIYSSLATYYVDRAGEAEAIGQIIPFTNNAYAELSPDQKRQLTDEKKLLFVYGGIYVPITAGLSSGNFVGWKEAFGYDPLFLRDSLYVGQPASLNFGASLVEGNFNTGVVRQVLIRDKYAETSPDYFALPGDAREIHRDAPTQHVTGPTSMLNRMALAQDTIIAGNNEDLVKAVHQSVRQGAQPTSLARTPAVTQIVDGLGKVHFALLFSSRLLPEAQKGVQGRAPFTPPADWGDLHPWTWAAVAYTRDLPARARFTVALGYTDATHAALDKAELQKRLQSYRPVIFPKPQQGDGRQEGPLTDACTLMEPKIPQKGNASALVISCSYDPLVKGGWWNNLVQSWDFNFLYAQKQEAGAH